MSTKVAEEYLTRREAAELAQVHLNTIRLWESTGRVNPVRTEGGIITIPKAEIEAIIESRRESGLTDASRIAALETEVRMLREERDRVIEEVHELREQNREVYDRIIALSGRGQEEGGE